MVRYRYYDALARIKNQTMRKIYLYEEFVNENRITWGAEEVHKLGNMPKKEFAAQHKGESIDIFFTKDGNAIVTQRPSNLVYHGKDAAKINVAGIDFVYAGLENEFYKPEDWKKLLNSVYKGKKASVYPIAISEDFVIEGSTFDEEYPIEEAKAGRAWAGKLKNVDNLMAWMYDKGILGKGDKNAKDSVFRQYYRYYNDGDFPGSLRAKGYNTYMPEEKIEAALEEMIEEFIKKILAKYSGKFDRSDFRYDMLLGDLNTLSDILKREDAYSLINYWSKEIDVKDNEFQALLQQLKEEYKLADEAVNKKLAQLGTPMNNVTISHRKKTLEDKNAWDKSESVPYNSMAVTMRKMYGIIEDVIQAAKRAKAL